MTAPPVSLSQFVLKIHSRCNLACDHCYVYEHADQSWREQPRIMAANTLRVAARRIAEHAASHKLGRVTVVLHGGEPLLVGEAHLRTMLAELRGSIDPVARLDLRMQSNGLLLSAPICDLLTEFDVHVGISLDGDRAANDRHRRYADGRSSHAHVLRALELLRRPSYRHIFAGILCTVDVRNDPIRVYESLLAHRPPRLDLLLPHATWDRPPERSNGGAVAEYGVWLARIYRQWVADGMPMPIRLFDSLISTANGGSSASEWVGLNAADLAVIETDGEWQQVDSLKTTFNGAANTGLNVFVHSADDIAAHPAIVQRGLGDLCTTCRNCAVVRQCGGGLVAHRYRSGSGFDNPSVYCADLKELIASMADRPHPPPEPIDSSLDVPAKDSPRDERPGQDPAKERLRHILDDIAAGYGDAHAVGYLADAESAITRGLVVAVGQNAGPTGPIADGWRLLSQLDRVAGAAVRSVLTHPYVRVWAVGWMRHSGPGADDGYLCRLAAAAAVRAGVEVDLAVPVREGLLILPTLGTVTLPHPGEGTARIVVAPGKFTIRLGDDELTVPTDDDGDDDGALARPPSGVWRPAQRIAADGLTLHLEDQDSYRDCYTWRAAGRLSNRDARDWRDSITAAWRLVQRDVAGHVPGMESALRVLVPLVADPSGQLRSATARHAFGAVGATPARDDALAVLLVHEFQHTKLGAVLDLVDLFDPAYRPRVRVGWKADPRPLEGAMQGTYAHLGVADIWRARAARPGAPEQAAAMFKQYRDWTYAAVEAMSSTGALTDEGTRFVRRMVDTMAGWPR